MNQVLEAPKRAQNTEAASTEQNQTPTAQASRVSERTSSAVHEAMQKSLGPQTVKDAVAEVVARLDKAAAAIPDNPGKDSEIPNGMKAVLEQKSNQIRTHRDLGDISQESVDRALEAVDADPDSPPSSSNPAVQARYQALRAQRAMMTAIRIAIRNNQTAQLAVLRQIRRQMERAMRSSMKRSGLEGREEEWIDESAEAEVQSAVSQENREVEPEDVNQVTNEDGQVVAERAGTKVVPNPKELKLAGVKPREEEELGYADKDGLRNERMHSMRRDGRTLHDLSSETDFGRPSHLEFARADFALHHIYQTSFTARLRNQQTWHLIPEESFMSMVRDKKDEFSAQATTGAGFSDTELMRAAPEQMSPQNVEDLRARVTSGRDRQAEPTHYRFCDRRGLVVTRPIAESMLAGELAIEQILGPLVEQGMASLDTAPAAETRAMAKLITQAGVERN